jgi:hypothetical protein
MMSEKDYTESDFRFHKLIYLTLKVVFFFIGLVACSVFLGLYPGELPVINEGLRSHILTSIFTLGFWILYDISRSNYNEHKEKFEDP